MISSTISCCFGCFFQSCPVGIFPRDSRESLLRVRILFLTQCFYKLNKTHTSFGRNADSLGGWQHGCRWPTLPALSRQMAFNCCLQCEKTFIGRDISSDTKSHVKVEMAHLAVHIWSSRYHLRTPLRAHPQLWTIIDFSCFSTVQKTTECETKSIREYTPPPIPSSLNVGISLAYTGLADFCKQVENFQGQPLITLGSHREMWRETWDKSRHKTDGFWQAAGVQVPWFGLCKDKYCRSHF